MTPGSAAGPPSPPPARRANAAAIRRAALRPKENRKSFVICLVKIGGDAQGAFTPGCPRQSYRKPCERRHLKIKQIQGQNCPRLLILKAFDKCMGMEYAAVLATPG